MRATPFVAETDSSPKPKWVSNKWRLVCLLFTATALFLVFRKIPAATLLKTIRDMRVGWFLGALLMYGLIFLPGARRWHFALRVNDSVANPAATVKFSIVGHFFYLLLFGGAGGDTAKAAVYARRYGFPLPKTLASVSLDRLMGSGAVLLIAGAAFAIAAAHGGFSGVKSLSIRKSVWWLLLIIPAVALIMFFLKRSRHQSVLHRFATAFLESGKRLVRSPRMVLTGFGCSLLMQVAVNAALAMNLQAVSHTPVPWLRLLWTFPIIIAVSGLPITFAGIGARDGAAIALLGWCGIATADAEATSLLTLCVSVFWGLVGGFVLWRETNTPRKPAEKSLE